MKFAFQEIKILSPSINSRWELCFRAKVQKTDYSLKDFEELCNNCDNYSFACVLSSFQEEKVDILPKLRQELVMAIKSYVEKKWYKEEEEVELLYKRNNVLSRIELSEEQLHSEIDRYRLGMFED